MSTIRVSAAELLLYRLSALQVDYAFINSGTDYPPLIEGLAKAQALGHPVPQCVICPHENAAMGMAHGYYLATGRSQAVMVHTNVGLANTVCALINAACNNIPTLVFGGRTPISEHDHFGCRNTPIGYGQEMRDQAALVRESVKWDFELRLADQTGEHVDRAWAIANSLPKGPVYLSLPREPLCEEFDSDNAFAPASQMPVSYQPDAAALEQAVTLLTHARQPVIFAQRGVSSPAAFSALSELAERWGIPVVENWGTQVAISATHPMAAGSDPEPWLSQADVVVVLDSLAPWMIDSHRPQANCQLIHIGPDPLFARYPVRGYRADVCLAGEVDNTLVTLSQKMNHAITDDIDALRVQRRQRVTAQIATLKQQRTAEIKRCAHGAIDKPWLSHCVGQLAERHNGVIVSELVMQLASTGITRPGSYFQEALSGGLGEALPIALGVQLADRQRLVIAAVGDGSYLFANPAACHQIAQAMALPVLVVIGNNGEWGAVAEGTTALYPDGYAARAAEIPAVSLAPSPDFGQIARSCGGQALRVERAEQLEATLDNAVEIIRKQRCPVLVDVRLGNQ